jgi:hypothetical protein
MRSLLIILALATALLAGEEPEDLRTASPDEVFQVRVVKVADTNTRRLEITQKDGKTLYSSPAQIDGTDIVDFYDDHLRWSPD